MAEHDQFDERLIAYALDALEPGEAREIEAHLSGCARCRSELEEWRETSSSLVSVVNQTEPGEDLRERILGEVRTLNRGQQKPAAADLKAYRSDIPFSSTLPWWRRPSGIAAIAASLLLVTVLASLVLSWRRERALKAEMASLSERLNEQANELARAKGENELLNSPDARMMMMSGTSAAPEARAKLMFDSKTGRTMLVASNLPAAPPGKAYQLWFIADGQAMPGRTFVTDAQGRAVMHDQIPEAGRNVSVFAVTLEPAAGVPAPTGEKYLLSAAS